MAPDRDRDAAGFTLVELLIPILVLALVLGGVYRAFFVGKEARRRGGGVLERQARVQEVAERMQQDLRNAVFYGPLPFEGEQNWVAFPVLLSVAGDLEAGPELCQVGYETVPDSGVVRQVRRLRDGAGSREALLGPGWDLSLEYLVENEEEEEWATEWEASGALPALVRVRLMPAGSAGEVALTVRLPQGE